MGHNHKGRGLELESTKGEFSRNSKLTDDIVRAIRSSEETPEQLAERYGVLTPHIVKIIKRKAWAHVK